MNIKQFAQLFVPPICYSIKRRLFPKKHPVIHPLPMAAHQNDRMIVIGNGPSLNKTMELYGDEVRHNDCAMVNDACLTKLYDIVHPVVYLMVDPVYFDPNHIEYASTLEATVNALITKTTWPMRIIMPQRAQGCYASGRLKENSNLEVLYYEDGWNLPKGMTQFEAWDKNVICPPAQTVLNTAIWLSLYWGYKETYIIGADSSWMEDTHVDQTDNRVYTVDTHFYKNEDVYTDASLWSENRRYIPSTYHEEIETVYIIFKSYWELRRYAEWKGVKIYNACEYSCIDAFERKKLK